MTRLQDILRSSESKKRYSAPDDLDKESSPGIQRAKSASMTSDRRHADTLTPSAKLLSTSFPAYKKRMSSQLDSDQSFKRSPSEAVKHEKGSDQPSLQADADTLTVLSDAAGAQCLPAEAGSVIVQLEDSLEKACQQEEASVEAPDNQDRESDEAQMKYMEFDLEGTLLKEATIDSPSFRASAEFVHVQINEIMRWTSTFANRLEAMSALMDPLWTAVNSIVGDFEPPFIHQNVLAQDYAALALARYSTATTSTFSSLISKIKTHYSRARSLIEKLNMGSFREYREARRQFEVKQLAYDEVSNSYAAIPCYTDPKMLRDAAWNLFDTRQQYLEACHCLCLAISTFEATFTVKLVGLLCDPFQLRTKSLISDLEQDPMELGIDMHRLRMSVQRLKCTIPRIRADLKKMIADFRAQASRSRPSQRIEDYYPVNEFLPQNYKPAIEANCSAKERFEYLHVKVNDTSKHSRWVRRWAFVRGGYFGWLTNSINHLMVHESPKISLLNCSVTPLNNVERRFCFMLDAQDKQIILQTFSRDSLKAWIDVFEYGKPVQRSRDIVMPWLADPEFPKTTHDDFSKSMSRRPSSSSTPRCGSSSDFDSYSAEEAMLKSVNSRVETLTEKLLHSVENVVIFGCVTPGSSGKASLVPTIFSVKPMPTAKSFQASIANNFLHTNGVPSAVTANYWGSVNWATFNTKAPSIFGNKTPNYPGFYPEQLKYQDYDMRAITEGLINPPASDDLLLLVVRCVFSLGQNKEVPGRLYITSKQIFCFVSWQGLVGVMDISMSDLVQVETTAGCDYDNLQLVINKDDDYRVVFLKLYIDSGLLVQRRMQFLIENNRFDPQRSLRKVLTILSDMGDVFSSNVQNAFDQVLYQKTLKSWMPHLGTDNESSEEKDPVFGTPARTLLSLVFKSVAQEGQSQLKTVPKWAFNLDKNEQMLTEVTYQVSPKTLFYTMFGEKSPVFQNWFPIINTDKTELGAWCIVNKRLERKIKGYSDCFSEIGEPGAKDGKNSFALVVYQRLDYKQDDALYSVTEEHPAWKLPHNQELHTTFRYLIFAGESGTCMQIWCRAKWKKHERIAASVLGETLNKRAINESRHVVERVRQAISWLRPSSNTATSAGQMFGRVRAVAAIKKRDINEGSNVILVQRRILWKAFLVAPLLFVFNLFHILVFDFSFNIGGFMKRLHKSGSPFRLVTICLIISLLFNFVLVFKTSNVAWHSYWAEYQASKYVDELGFGMNTNILSRRTVSLSEIEKATRSGTLFNWTAEELTFPCNQEFSKLTESNWAIPRILSERDFPVVRKLNKIQTEFGLQRANVVKELHLLNAAEQEAMKQLHAEWLYDQLMMCSRAREILPQLNEMYAQNILDYCLSCTEPASNPEN